MNFVTVYLSIYRTQRNVIMESNSLGRYRNFLQINTQQITACTQNRENELQEESVYV